MRTGESRSQEKQGRGGRGHNGLEGGRWREGLGKEMRCGWRRPNPSRTGWTEGTRRHSEEEGAGARAEERAARRGGWELG